jgi:hypothetical protein
MHRSSRFRAAICAIVLLSVAGCTRLEPVDVPSPPVPAMRLTRPAVVTLMNQRQYELTDVIIANDSLFGQTNDPIAPVRVTIHLSQVARVEERQKDLIRSLMLATILVAIVLYSGVAGTGLR